MTDVSIGFGPDASQTARDLLDAAKALDLDATEVRTGQGMFVVDEKIAKKAGYGDKPKKTAAEKAPAKKTAAKKTAAKKTAAKKTTAKKAARLQDHRSRP